jgi:hypothetical protein
MGVDTGDMGRSDDCSRDGRSLARNGEDGLSALT